MVAKMRNGELKAGMLLCWPSQPQVSWTVQFYSTCLRVIIESLHGIDFLQESRLKTFSIN